jgi:hypothetical protein
VRSVLTEPVWGEWALDRYAAEELAAYLRRAKPLRLLECGSGMSTVLMAEHCRDRGGHLWTLEHSGRYAGLTRQALLQRGLSEYVTLLEAPLVPMKMSTGLPDGELTVDTFWYDAQLPDGIDFALIDGPPGKYGRHATLPAILPRMVSDRPWEIWLDDANRPGEQGCLDLWREILPDHYTEQYVALPKGLMRLTSWGQPATTFDASDVAVTLLTGDRPDLLRQTVTSLLIGAPGLLDSAHVAVLHNGGDRETADVLAEYREMGWIDKLTTLPDRLPIGDAAGALLGFPPPRPYTLHLEDDWQVATADPGWLDAARTVLAEMPDVHQVRLRHRGEPVLDRHMLTRKPLVWRQGPAGSLFAPAHFTLNPSLMRSADCAQLWPASGENGAARNFYAFSWKVAQLTPGAFHHLGDGASLRMGQRP